MKRITLVLMIFFSMGNLFASQFEKYFENKTLRIDYLLSGTDVETSVSLHQLASLLQWAGRKVNLDKLCYEGNAQVVVKDYKTGLAIYKDAFSSLFFEWQRIDEAKQVRRSFEHTVLLPYPKDTILVEILFRDKNGKYYSGLEHQIDPKDILIKEKGVKNITPYITLHKSNKPDKAVNVVILAEGFTEQEIPLFLDKAKIACEQILAHKPFDELKDKFNFYAVKTISEDSKVSVPRTNKWKRTAVSSHFDTFYSERYLTTSHISDMHDLLAGIPYSHIIILANTDVYGGGGIFNSYTLTTTGHKGFKPVVVHEFGHSFAGLADEYFYEGDTMDDTYELNVEPWEPNITTKVDFEKKWKNILGKEFDGEKVSLIEGAAYSAKGIYRSSPDCRMKTNSAEKFCPVCQKSIDKLVKFYTEQK